MVRTTCTMTSLQSHLAIIITKIDDDRSLMCPVVKPGIFYICDVIPDVSVDFFCLRVLFNCFIEVSKKSLV